MAVYYDEYGEHSYDAAAFDHQGFYDTDPRCYDPGYDVAPAEYYEPCGEEYMPDVWRLRTGSLGIGYWEEYYRRRYEILYGSDVGEEVESPETSERDGELAFHAVAAGPYEHNLSEEHVEDATEFHGVEDAALAWQLMWERGPLRWRCDVDASSRTSRAARSCGPESDEELVHDVTSEYVEESPDAVHGTPSFEGLQASYDRGEILESDREECAKLLSGPWPCELEDQRLLAAGYICDGRESDFMYSVFEPLFTPIRTIHHVADSRLATAPITPRKICPSFSTFTRRRCPKTSSPTFLLTRRTKISRRRAFAPNRSRPPALLAHTCWRR
ncbi:hypothetical protein FB451DRAFT_1168280 [Mycena latifolia]|nr:hypothetical protein FB451DRAFT_1168280 [Mycena latifolia]